MPTTPENTQQSDEPVLTSGERIQVKAGARWLRRIANPFVDFHVIITVGTIVSSTTNEASQRQDNPDVQGYLKDLTPIQREIYAEDFKQIIKHLPFLKVHLESNSESSRSIQKILNAVQTAADGGKHDDTGAIKGGIIKLIPRKCLPEMGRDDDPNTAESYLKDIRAPYLNKAWRGFNHILTAMLLCPVDHLAAMKANPDKTRTQLMERELLLIDNDGDPMFPLFLYDQDLMDGSATRGLLRGPLLLAVYLHIFISPSTAVGAKSSSKRGNAKIHGMARVIPSTICYAAIQVYVALCSIDKWGEKWEEVNLGRLYILLREQLAQPNDPWVVETLKWWNQKVFGDSPEPHDRRPGASGALGPTMRERMEHERQERVRAVAPTPGNEASIEAP